MKEIPEKVADVPYRGTAEVHLCVLNSSRQGILFVEVCEAAGYARYPGQFWALPEG